MQALNLIVVFMAVTMLLHVGIANLLTYLYWKDKNRDYADKHKVPAYMHIHVSLIIIVISHFIIGSKIEDILYITCSIIVGYTIGGYYRKYL